MSNCFLKLRFVEKENQTAPINELEYRNKPFSNSEVFWAPIENFQQITHGVDVKTVFQLDLSLKDIEHSFLPGDTIAILPENDQSEVNELFIRLNVEGSCDKRYCLEILKETTKKNATIPKHIPPSSTLHKLFLKHIDIRTSPKKIFLKSLIRYTRDSKEQENLEKICSPTGSQEYAKLLTEHRTLLSLLNAFPSCLPPIELILEHSTPLNPRFFSIASSPLERTLSIIFFIVKFESGLKGVCTGWLQRLLQEPEFRNKKIPFYFRKPGVFRFDNIENPSILIATGTGMAPFRGFLRHKQILSRASPNLSETWMFYGCRYADRDFLCRNELENYVKDGVLSKLDTAFSRDTERKVYVQQKIADCRKEIVELIIDKNASIFICGDAKSVVKDVREMILQLFTDCNRVDSSEAELILSNLIKNKRYVVDTWI